MLDNSCLQKFSTDDIPDRDKIPLWRDHFGRSVAKMDFVPVDDVFFRCVSFARELLGLKMWSCAITESEVHRTPALAADGDDNLVFAIVRKGRARVSQNGREAIFGPGEAVLWSADIAGVYRNLGAVELTTLSLPRQGLTGLLSDPNKAVMTAVPSSTGALKLLIQYAGALMTDTGPMAPALQATTAAHVQDLVLLALGATHDAGEAAGMRGLRAVRLQAIKRDVLANLGEQSLSVSSVASRHSISPRYIRSLFESDHTTFTDFVREQRLRFAHRMLTDAALADRSISTIAFDAGFGDISYFNQVFRRRYGATPSDVRTEARNWRLSHS